MRGMGCCMFLEKTHVLISKGSAKLPRRALVAGQYSDS